MPSSVTHESSTVEDGYDEDMRGSGAEGPNGDQVSSVLGMGKTCVIHRLLGAPKARRPQRSSFGERETQQKPAKLVAQNSGLF